MNATTIHAGLTCLASAVCLGMTLAGCSPASDSGRTVAIYVSTDQEYAEPILKEFERTSGIRVLAVYDVEATKTTGLANRLVAEKDRPQADVFWNSEFAQTMLLKEGGILAPYDSPSAADLPASYRDPEGCWTAFGGRARIFIINTNLVKPADYPRSMQDLLAPRWPADKVAVSHPLFGTAATHAAALYAAWGPEKARKFFADLAARGVRVAAGNSVVRDMVVGGQAWWGIVDTDDAAVAIARGAPVAAVFPDQGAAGSGTLVIPNTVAMVAGAPHPREARALLDYLVGLDAERQLVESGWSHVPPRLPGATAPFKAADVKRLDVHLQDVYAQLGRAKKELAEIFVK